VGLCETHEVQQGEVQCPASGSGQPPLSVQAGGWRVVEAPFLEAFKAKLDGALSNLVWLKMSLLTAGRLGSMTCKGAFQPKAFYDSMSSDKIFLLNMTRAVTASEC